MRECYSENMRDNVTANKCEVKKTVDYVLDSLGDNTFSNRKRSETLRSCPYVFLTHGISVRWYSG
jgi:hypothetical protein